MLKYPQFSFRAEFGSIECETLLVTEVYKTTDNKTHCQSTDMVTGHMHVQVKVYNAGILS